MNTGDIINALNNRDGCALLDLVESTSYKVVTQTIVNRLIETNDVNLLSFLHDEVAYLFRPILLHIERILKADCVALARYLFAKGMFHHSYAVIALETSLEMTRLIIPEYFNIREYANIIHLSGNLEIAKYLIDKVGYMITDIDIINAVMAKRMDLLSFFISKYRYRGRAREILLKYAIINHDMKDGTSFIEWLLNIGAVYTPYHSESVCSKGLLDILILFHTNGYKISGNASSNHKFVDDYLRVNRLGIYEE